MRQSLGIADDEYFILQPTRIIKRKGIEHAIELVSRLGLNAKLVISHASGDEGYDYENRIREYSKLLNVKTIFVSRCINENGAGPKKGKNLYPGRHLSLMRIWSPIRPPSRDSATRFWKPFIFQNPLW
ncbi:MAG: hypothetical protein R2861_03775 [Desulfobacterales bacterium]